MPTTTNNFEKTEKLESNGRPVLRWAGSKRKLLPRLLQYTPGSFRRYIEPFAGSACLFAALQPKRAILGDLNNDLIHAYSMIAADPDAIAAIVLKYPRSSAAYYKARSLNPADLSDLERAGRFVYLNRHCFNGVYRTNKAGTFNVPMGSKLSPLPTVDHFRHWAQLLKNVKLVAGDFDLCVKKAGAGDFVYLDPPYALNDERFRGEYGYGSFNSSDLGRLAAALHHLDLKGATFLLSYRCKKSVRNLLRVWHQRTLEVRRHVSGFSGGRSNVRELLISNRELPSKGEL